MGSVPPLLTFLLAVVSRWVHRRHLLVIGFLQAKNRMLKNRLRGKRIRFTDAIRALLTRKAKAVGPKALMVLDTSVSSDTRMRWHRRLVAQKWDSSHRRGPGRLGIMRDISQLIVRMAVDNPGWGCTRIQGALANLDHKVGRGTISNVLKANGVEPTPKRGQHIRWSTFLKAHWKVFAASNFFSVDVWTPRGLVTYYVLFVFSIADRVVDIAGVTNRPDESWMLQIGRHLLDAEDGVLAGKRYLIVDRDTKYSKRIRDFIAEGGAEVIRLPPLSPNLNAFAERFVRSIKEECFTKMIFVGQGSLGRALTGYMTHFDEERNHQGLGNRLIRGYPAVAASDASIHRRTRLGGMLSYYDRIAA